MAVTFTAEQIAAIKARGRTLLVSAAAGSGKTATLTRRIISGILDPDSGRTLSRLLVVTFTVSAAADMREKIKKALDEAIAADPENPRLLRESMLLPTAEICTIDSLCNRILRQNAEAADVPPGFRIPDPAEADLLALETMETLLADLYAGEVEGIGVEEFCRLSDTLTSAKGEDALASILWGLSEELACDPRGATALLEARDRYQRAAALPFLKSEFGAEAIAAACAPLSSLITRAEAILDALDGSDEPSLAKRLPHLAMLTDVARRVRDGLLAADASVLRLMREDYGQTPPVRGEVSPDNRAITPLAKSIKETLRSAYATYFSSTDAENAAYLTELAALSDLLYRVLVTYESRLWEEKKRRRLCTFSDVSRRVLSLLSENGEPTPLAKALRTRYDEIYIDEFQDVNALQYEIFRALAREDNLFMVGDVKQSIYGFRHASPAIFAELRRAYLTPAEETAPASLFFTKNFRCDRPIVRYVNEVAGTLFRHAGRTVDYLDKDDLAFAKLPPAGEEPVRTYVFEEPSLPEEEEGEESEGAVGREAAFVAKEIARLLKEGRKSNGEPIRPGDIVLLFSARSQMPVFRRALEGTVKVSTDADGDFFLSPEVLLALSLLNTVNNPRRDIPLAATLRSPIFGLTMEELALIRHEDKHAPSLYDALSSYVGRHPEFRKGQRFLDRLEAWRRVAEGETVAALLLTVYHDTALLSLFGEGSEAHHDNLYRLYEYARSFEGSSYHGLYSFISFINRAIEAKKTVIPPAREGEEDTVRFMTAHGSKGLEFPVVFLCNTQRSFLHADRSTSFIYDKTYGPAACLLSSDGRVRLRTPVYELYRHREREATAEEQIRLLYVALTRARERLYVTGTCRSLDTRIERAEDLLAAFTESSVLAVNNWLTWILATRAAVSDPYLSLMHAEETEGGEAPLPIAAESGAQDASAPTESDAALPLLAETKRNAAMLSERFAFVYPDSEASALPEKLTVSRLYPEVLDGSEEGETQAALPAELRPVIPTFLSGITEDEGARRGTATHLFLQFCDLGRLEKDGVLRERDRLVEARFLRPEEAALVRCNEIERFVASPLFREMLAATRLRRELRFHSLLPAADFTADEARRRELAAGGRTLLVQGVIDCIIESEEGYDLIDYKTDRTPRDREEARRLLVERHREQLSYYAAACTQMYGAPPRRVLIYSLALGESIEVK